MNLVSVRIITENVAQLAQFYEAVTGLTATHYTEDFAEFKTATATLAIGNTRTLQLFGGSEVAQAAQNRTAIIEFMVNDVDAVYQSQQGLIDNTIIQKPTTMPWGNRSLLFRDPDGNLVNFFTPATAEAIAKFSTNPE